MHSENKEPVTGSVEIMTAQPSQQLVESRPESSKLLELITASKNINLDKMDKLVALYDKVRADEALRAYNADFIRMKPNLPRVLRTKENSQTTSKYAPLEDINAAIDPILSQFGFGSSFTILNQTKDDVTAEIQVRHSGGHIEKTVLTMPLDKMGPKGTVNKTDIQAIASTITYLKRVGLGLILNISTGDDKDGNGASIPLSNEQAVEIDLAINEMSDAKDYKPKFLAYMKAESVQTIPATDYEKAKNAIAAKRARNNPSKVVE